MSTIPRMTSHCPWDWNETLSSPAFWASYYELHTHLDYDQGDTVFGADVYDITSLERTLHNHYSKTLEYYRELLTEARGDVEAVVAKTRAANPFAEQIPTFDDDEREKINDAMGVLPANKVLELILGDDLAFVIEFAPGSTRFNIRDRRGELNLGHLSGHQSLPALRWSEVFEIERRVKDLAFSHRFVGPLLWPAAMTSLGDDVENIARRLEEGSSALPFVSDEARDEFLRCLASKPEGFDLEPVSAPGMTRGFAWWRSEQLGWVNNSAYSTRNPLSFWGREFKELRGFERVRTLADAVENDPWSP